MKMQRISRGVFLAGLCAALAAASPLSAQAAGSAQFVMTASVKGSNAPPVLQQNNVSVTVKNRPAEITQWQPLRGADAGLQLVFLFDESAPSYLALQIPSLRTFIQGLPASAEVGVAYMANGRAVFTQKLTSDHALAAKSLRITNSIPGVSASPYFCLSDLAKHWPSSTKTRRVVFMVTNGEDPYYMQADMQDPYLSSAISDSQRAGMLVYSIYFKDVGFRRAGSFGRLIGQSYLLRLADETGGQTYANGLTTVVSFDPYLAQFKTSLENQYMVSITAQGSGLQRIKVKSNLNGVKLSAPAAVNVGGQ